jgi:tight adherence protein C
MDLKLVGCMALAGGCSFAAAYVATLSSAAHTSQSSARASPLNEAVERVRRLAVVRGMEERAEVARMRAECLRQMPVMLDVVTLGLSAGLSFDSALELYCQRYTNVLSRALGTAMLTWRLGTASREEALEAMARRMGVSALERFAGVVAQALAFGSPLAATLEQQAQAIREEQRAQMEEEIEQVPVRMMIPLGTLIVPAMLLAILGPLLGASLAVG